MSKEIRLRQGKVGSKQLPELIYRGEGDAQEGKRETLKELIVGASDVYFKVRAAKQKSSIMLGELGCTQRQRGKFGHADLLQQGGKEQIMKGSKEGLSE